MNLLNSIIYKLSLVKQCKEDIRQALIDKGIDMDSAAPLSEYPEYIKRIAQTPVSGLGTERGILPYIKAPAAGSSFQSTVSGLGTVRGLKPYVKVPVVFNSFQSTARGLNSDSSAEKE